DARSTLGRSARAAGSSASCASLRACLASPPCAAAQGSSARQASTVRARATPSGLPLTLAQRGEELRVALGAGEAGEQHLHGLGGVHVGDDLPQQPHLRERGLVEEQVLAARARLQDVDGREDAALLELPREV